jgi:hypothetical protein
VISGNNHWGININSACLVEGNLIGANVTGTASLENSFGGINITAAGATIGGTSSAAANVISGNGNGYGINIDAACLVVGNLIGTNASGMGGLGNNGGISAVNGSGITIGGTTAGAGNVISGNADDGIFAGAPELIDGNLIGTDPTGTFAVPNGDGVDIQGTGVTIGGTTAEARNIISGNKSYGVVAAVAGLIEGNFIGTNQAGTLALANGNDGVNLDGQAAGSTVGGTSAGAGNVISGNAGYGVVADSVCIIEANLIGTDTTGTLAVPNASGGVNLSASGVTIGGTISAAANVISGNTGDGIDIEGPGALVEGNRIGTNEAGTAPIGNSANGVNVFASGTGATIGGTATGATNTVSGNSYYGIFIEASCLVMGNRIGTNGDGNAAIGNHAGGVSVQAPGATIGGTTSGAGNVISGNNINDFEDGVDLFASGLVEGNLIGTDVTGTAALANGEDGINVFSSGVTIGGTTSSAANAISGNRTDGIRTDGSTLIEGNLIGTTVTGDAAIPNSQGIDVYGSGVTIGGTIAGAANVISGNGNGILIEKGSGTLVEGNFIGTNAAGTAALGNTESGVDVIANGSTVGGTSAGAGNVISGNAQYGILASAATLIEGNLIGTNAAGTGAIANDGGVGVFASNVTIGGTVSGATNVISGNTYDGIDVVADDVLVEGNLIGTNQAGAAALANQFDGVDVDSGVTGVTIGGTTAVAANVISGNGAFGIYAVAPALIEGNLIGTARTGDAAIPDSVGVGVYGSGVTIGGTVAGATNVISGNHVSGIQIVDGSGTLIEGNLIGTNEAGTAALGNTIDGVDVYVTGATIGGTAVGAGNVISGNSQWGIDAPAATLIEGNLIGTNAVGTDAVPNIDGVFVTGSGVTIGGTVAGSSNLISGNANDGIDIYSSNAVVAGNLIGTNEAGTDALPNQGAGVYLGFGTDSADSVGVDGVGNIVAFNGSAGVATAYGTTGGTIRYNSIFENGTPGIDLNDDGVTPNTLNGSTNKPVLTGISDGVITGTLNAEADNIYVIDFYASPPSDASATRPQGRTYLGSTTISTNALGEGFFSAPFPYTVAGVEPFVTATATNSDGTTSEFSSPVAYGITSTGLTFTATIGVPFEGQVATFTSTDAAATSSDFTATIDYGDGSALASGTVVAYNGGFVVIGSHTYSTAGVATPVIVTITDTLGYSGGTANSLAVVSARGGTLTPFGKTPVFVAGTSSSQVVASFSDSSITAFPGQFTALITWGDGSAASTGTVVADGSGVDVIGTHTYASSGTDGISVVISDAISGSSATANSVATVTPANYTPAATGVDFSAAAGIVFQGTVANFTSTAPGSTASNFTATINFGDGSASVAGTVLAAPGGFIVVGSHTYATANPTFPVTVTITDMRGYGQTTANSVADVGSGLTAYGRGVNFVAGTLYSGVVASFTDSFSQAISGQFTTTINWGDGSTSSNGTVSIDGAGFDVTGTHTYDFSGTYPVTVTIHDQFSGSTVTASGTATVAPVPITLQTKNFIVTGGTAFSGTVATFTDSEPRTNPTYYTATINWGDGKPNTVGTITGSNPFTVTGSHTFASFSGTDLVTITITDPSGRSVTGVDLVFDPTAPAQPPSGASTSTGSTPSSGSLAPLAVEPSVINVPASKPFDGVVATFVDSGQTEPARAYKATINWGKGRRTAGMITGSNGHFLVTARHAFPRFIGSKPVVVTVTEPDGQSISITDSAIEASRNPKVVKVTQRPKHDAKEDR